MQKQSKNLLQGKKKGVQAIIRSEDVVAPMSNNNNI